MDQEKRNNQHSGHVARSPSNVTQIPQHMSKILEATSPTQVQMHRSKSLAQGSNDSFPHHFPAFTEVSHVKTKAEQQLENESQKSLLALANANVKKLNIGQAVSAFTASKPAPVSTHIPNALLRTNSGPSKQTKLSLRNAIMDKPNAQTYSQGLLINL